MDIYTLISNMRFAEREAGQSCLLELRSAQSASKSAEERLHENVIRIGQPLH